MTKGGVDKKGWWVYILLCKDDKLYTGITDNLERRINQHNAGNGCKFTKYRIPVKLVYKEKCLSKSDALKREIEIKGWTRKKKLSLFEVCTSDTHPQCHQK
ncbi:MAG: GIY-YIG nuclease family protein [Candidatus Omnitrophica bacterium]|nr:GIY-YIG nuclease family protein [Candidatus Omnitrophota bacterium]MDD5081720.1 GIY-YIG nuclease family protein [Candidatus Omnitrophota bacterium]